MHRLRTRPLRWLCSILLLLGCSITASACSSSSSSGTALPQVTGAYGSDPQIAVPGGTPPSKLIVQTLVQGSGPVISASDLALVYVEGKVWAGDREVFDSYTNRQPQSVPLATGGVLPAWKQLAGQRVGSRVMMVVPPADGFGSQGNQQLNVAAGDTLVFVFDLLSSVPENAAAHGATVPYHPAAGMPAVSVGTGTAATPAEPKITIPAKATPPTTLVTDTLIRGTGAPITSGQTVVVQYTGVVWRSDQVFDSSYATQTPDSFVLGAGQVIPGWEQGLGGVRVGSRVLLVIPPALAYGDQAEPPYIQDNDTLVFVVDVIDAYTPQTA